LLFAAVAAVAVVAAVTAVAAAPAFFWQGCLQFVLFLMKQLFTLSADQHVRSDDAAIARVALSPIRPLAVWSQNSAAAGYPAAAADRI